MDDRVSKRSWARYFGWFGGRGRCFQRLAIIGLFICTIAAAIAGYSFTSGNIMAAMGLSVVGCSVSLLSAVAFIVSSLSEARRWSRRTTCAVVVLLLPLLVCVGGIALESGRQQRWIERTQNAMAALVADIEAIRTQTGHVPRDERELVDRLGKAMPSLARQTTLRYERDRSDPKHYRIWCIADGFAGDILEYDSRNASRGIVHRSL